MLEGQTSHKQFTGAHVSVHIRDEPMTLMRQKRCCWLGRCSLCSHKPLKMYCCFFCFLLQRSSLQKYSTTHWAIHVTLGWGVGVMLLEGGFWGIIQLRTNNPWQPGGRAIHHLPCPALMWGGKDEMDCLYESARTKAALTHSACVDRALSLC